MTLHTKQTFMKMELLQGKIKCKLQKEEETGETLKRRRTAVVSLTFLARVLAMTSSVYSYVMLQR